MHYWAFILQSSVLPCNNKILKCITRTNMRTLIEMNYVDKILPIVKRYWFSWKWKWYLPYKWCNYIQVTEWSEIRALLKLESLFYFFLATYCSMKQHTNHHSLILISWSSTGTVTREMHIFIQETEGRSLSSQLINVNYERSINSVVIGTLSFEYILLFFSLTYFYIFIYSWFLMSYTTTFEKFRSEVETTTYPSDLFPGWKLKIFSWLPLWIAVHITKNSPEKCERKWHARFQVHPIKLPLSIPSWFFSPSSCPRVPLPYPQAWSLM